MPRIVETEKLAWKLHGEANEIHPDRLKDFETLALEHLEAARIAAEGAYAPYSKFRVGASIAAEKKAEIAQFIGCNIENASYGATMCAERVAIHSAIARGYWEIRLLALSTLDSANHPNLSHRSPCGLCRQVMSEFFTSGTLIVIDGGKNDSGRNRVDLTTIDELLPWRFVLEEPEQR